MKKLVIPAIIALSLVACNNNQSFSNANKSGTAVAKVNNVIVTKEEVELNLKNIPAKLIAGREEEVKGRIIDQLIKQELVLQQADKENIKNNPEFKDLYDSVVNNLVYNFMVNKAVKSKVNDETIKAEYEKNKAKYTYKTVKARHILVKTEDEAKKIIEKLNAGENFAELAKTNSTGPSAKNGGDLGWFKITDMVPSFAKAAFALEKGSYTKKPVKTQFGWHVILVEDNKNDNVASFEMVKQPLSQNLTNKAMQEYLDGLKAKAKINMLNKPKAEKVAKSNEKTATK